MSRREQRQQIAMKAKKLNIEFDSIGKNEQNGNYGTAEEINEEKPEKEEKKDASPKVVGKMLTPTTVPENNKPKKMKSISSTDYE